MLNFNCWSWKYFILKFLDNLKHKTEVQSSKPPNRTKRRSKRKRKDGTESSDMEWTASELKKHKTEVQSSKPPNRTKRSPKRKRKDEAESSNMEWTASEVKHTTPSKKARLTDTDYKLQNNTWQPKEMKYEWGN